MKFFVDSNTTVSPIISNYKSKNIIDVFKDLLISLIKDQKIIPYDLINDDILTFNNGLNNNDDFSIYEISDGIRTIYSKLNKVDINNYRIVEDISGFDKKSIEIKSPILNAYFEETKSDYIFSFKREMKIRIPKDSLFSFFISNNSIEKQVNINPAAQAKTSSGSEWFCFFNDYSVLFSCQNTYAAPFFNSIYYFTANKDGFIEVVTNPSNGANTGSEYLVFDYVNDFSFKNYTSVNRDSGFFGVSRILFDNGYVASEMLITAGLLNTFKRNEPILINENIIIFQMLRDSYMGMYYGR